MDDERGGSWTHDGPATPAAISLSFDSALAPTESKVEKERSKALSFSLEEKREEGGEEAETALTSCTSESPFALFLCSGSRALFF